MKITLPESNHIQVVTKKVTQESWKEVQETSIYRDLQAHATLTLLLTGNKRIKSEEIQLQLDPSIFDYLRLSTVDIDCHVDFLNGLILEFKESPIKLDYITPSTILNQE